MVHLTEELSEFLGMHVGDGTLYKTNPNSLVWEQRGDLLEKGYYNQYVFPLVNKLFGVQKLPKFRSGGKQGCYGIQTCNKKLTGTILKSGIKPGKKSNIAVPKCIMRSNSSIKKAFLRGYFDTDGCLRFEKGTYPRIEFSTISKQLRDDVCLILANLGFRSFVWNIKNLEYRTCLAGKKNYLKWKNEIGTHNPKHLKKFSMS